MPPTLALLICFLFIIFIFWFERKRNAEVSWALFIPLLWYLLATTRPIASWLSIWDIINLPESMDPTEGNIHDACFLGILIVIGIYIVARRHCDWNAIIRENKWLLMIFAFMALSILWSQYPIVSFKRVIRSFGTVVMVLVVLTEPKPVEAISAVLRRCAYITIPLSIVLIRYFRHIGVDWDWTGNAVSWIGVATSKNTLGQVAVAGAFCFIWERIRRRNSKEGRIIDYLYIIMSLYLLKGSDDALSMTSLSVFAVGFLIFISLSFTKIHTERVKPLFILTCIIVFGIILTVIYHSLNPFSTNSFMGSIIKLMGRDMTLSGRTEIWSDVYTVASRSPVIGVGYGAFWIGRLANIPWTEKLTWILGQAHNGYVDIYLQLGLVGVCLLIALILFTIPKIIRTFKTDFEYGRFRMTFFLVILFVNITESTLLRSNHNTWFLFLLAVLTVPHTNGNIIDADEATAAQPAY